MVVKTTWDRHELAHRKFAWLVAILVVAAAAIVISVVAVVAKPAGGGTPASHPSAPVTAPVCNRAKVGSYC